jgi:hypothetical protein
MSQEIIFDAHSRMLKKWTPTTALILGRHTNPVYSFPKPPFAPIVYAAVDATTCYLTLKWIIQPSITSVTLIIDGVVVPGIEICQSTCSYLIPNAQQYPAETVIDFSLTFGNAAGQGVTTTGQARYVALRRVTPSDPMSESSIPTVKTIESTSTPSTTIDTEHVQGIPFTSTSVASILNYSSHLDISDANFKTDIGASNDIQHLA